MMASPAAQFPVGRANVTFHRCDAASLPDIIAGKSIDGEIVMGGSKRWSAGEDQIIYAATTGWGETSLF
jgi:hypothetical protein